MSMHLHKFIDRIKGFEARGAKDFTMSLSEAKDLHSDITKLLIDLQNLRESAVVKTPDESTISVQIQGGTFR
jgi:hypothetical protein